MTASAGTEARPGSRMPVADHLKEARRRAVWAAAALLIGSVMGWLLSESVMELLRSPVTELAESQNASLNYDRVTAAFDLRLKIAMYTGVVLSSPVWLYQLLAFLTPGLTRGERRYTLGFLGAALPLFLAGACTGFSLFPHMVQLLAGFGGEQDSVLLQAGYYVDFVLRLVLAVGAAFVLPVVLVMLNFLGLLSAGTIWRSWRPAVVAVVLFSALATPAADVLSLFLVAVPMTALYLAAAAVASLREWLITRKEIQDAGSEP
ncbi:twin-arginine translocase subunit TatC [Nesterenkonia ebinurensis]|uniref:twin-arginine translocase subunit TatC n=1 Tax=Nesterenkonia ebinurensis TaxID=2608252 RepID=UPI001CC6D5C9|nr:twin-arginine translocase subunit TatC [Nesterenkonia ebinurensis]